MTKVVRLTGIVMALGLLLAAVVQPTTAQENSAACRALLDEVIAAAQEACSDLAPGEVCYGSGPVMLEAAETAGELTFAESGDIINAAAVGTLTTSDADLDEETLGVAVLSLGEPEADSPPLSMILFGEASLAPLAAEDSGSSDAVTLTLTNAAGYPVNLRAGAGTAFAVAGTLDENLDVVTDGRSADGTWFRIQLEDGAAWVFHELVTIEGDPVTLPVLADDDVSASGAALPVPTFTLTSAAQADLACGSGSAGLLVQYSGESAARIILNGAALTFEGAAFLVQAAPGEAMRVLVIDGGLRITAAGETVEAETGAAVTLELSGDDERTPGAPVLEEGYSFAAIDGAPLALLPEQNVCIVGLDTADDPVTLFTGPGQDYTVFSDLEPGAQLSASGQTRDADGQTWLLVEIDGQQVWVFNDNVRSVGQCSAVAEVPPPSQAGDTATNSGGAAGASGSFVPTQQTVWQADSGPDIVSGTCNNPPLALCSHLAAIIPNPDGTVQWRGQEPIPYTMTPIAENVFSYTGRNALNTGSINMTLTFDSPTTWHMTMIQVFDDDPQCQHQFNYTATFNW